MRSCFFLPAIPVLVVTAVAFLCGSGHGGDVPAPIATARGATSDGSVTFTRDVAPILYANCAACHRSGEVAPFSLLSYSDAKRWAPMIAQITTKRIMPPWKPEPGFGEFNDVRALSAE